MSSTNNAEVQFGGECAFALSTGKRGVKGLPAHQLVRDGKVYYFSNFVAKLLFRILPNRIQKAEKTWQNT